MEIWRVVLIWGAIGGLVGSFLPMAEIPWPDAFRAMTNPKSSCRFAYPILHIARNVITGSLAAFILWAANNFTAHFADTGPLIGTAGYAAGIGLVGVVVLNRIGHSQNVRGGTLELAQLTKLIESDDADKS